MNSKSKGDIGEIRIMMEFAKRNIPVSIPFGDNCRYDLIADFNGKLNRIQVKYCNQKSVNDSVLLVCSSSTNHTTNKKYTTYTEDVDYFAFYIPVWDIALLVPIEAIGKHKSINVRKTTPKNNQSNVHLVSDFMFDKVLGISVAS